MGDASNLPADPTELSPDQLPGGLSAGSTVLVASAGDPSRYAVDLRLLREYGRAADRALIVTTTESADRTVETYDQLCPAPERPSLGLVDTTSG